MNSFVLDGDDEGFFPIFQTEAPKKRKVERRKQWGGETKAWRADVVVPHSPPNIPFFFFFFLKYSPITLKIKSQLCIYIYINIFFRVL